jgi:hypothetical protein
MSASLLAGCVATKSRVPASDIGSQTIVLGRLGRPVGMGVTIHGHKLPRALKRDTRSFFVDSVDGQKLDSPRVLMVRGIEEWPDNTEATISGYEVGVIQFGFERVSGPPDQQSRQIMIMSFEPLEIIEPKTLKIGDEK